MKPGFLSIALRLLNILPFLLIQEASLVSCLQDEWHPASLSFDPATAHDVFGAATAAAVPHCQETQRVALLEFYKSGFNSTSNSTSWFSDPTPNCCDWQEVVCDTSGFVVSLQIYAGDELNYFDVSPLGRLQSLQALEVSNIGFDSSAIALFPSTITSLSISGSPARSPPIPWADLVAKLFRLTVLSLRRLPALDGTTLNPELCNLTHLETLTITSNNGLRGSIPPCLSMLPQLIYLDLSYNDLKGPIPQYWNATSPLEHLDLSLNFLTGFISPSSLGQNLVSLYLGVNNLTGSIPQSIANCTKLSRLDMHENQLSGEIPYEWGNLLNLEGLFLSGNQLVGEIPSSMGKLAQNASLVNPYVRIDLSSNRLVGDLPCSLLSIQELSLQSNYLTGRLRPNNGCEVSLHSNSSSLQLLDLSHNSLAGSLPSWIVSLRSLEQLNLSHNMLTGPLQHESFSNFSTKMIVLDLSFNHLTGAIPSWLSPLAALNSFSVSSNHLQGTIPLWFWSLPELSEFDLSRNQLSGDIHFQGWLCNGVDTETVSFSGYDNNFSRLVTPGGLKGKCCSEFRETFSLDLHSNDLSGEIPWAKVLPFQFNYAYLDFSDNRLTGEVPDQKWIDSQEQNMHAVRQLDLSHNLLGGSIPGWLGSQASVISIQLSFNNFTGEIPSGICYSLGDKTLATLKLDHNSLSGTIPDMFGDACKQLVSVVLANNHLTGPIPPSLSNLLSTLVVLDLSHNHLEGSLPAWIQQMYSLRVLSLSFNSLSGPLPSSTWNATKLQVLDLSNNNLSGSISAQSLSHMQGFRYSSIQETLLNSSQTLYDESITIRARGMDLEYTYILTATVSLDLSDNALSGHIPPQLGSLDGLIFLNLARNELTGQIPESLGNLTQINSLDLSANKLEGEIPEALCPLTFLAFVNVSSNNLRGRIPECNQWRTFSNESFGHNPSLCGAPLLVLCPTRSSGKPVEQASAAVSHADQDFLLATLVSFCCAFPVCFAATMFWWPLSRRVLKASQWIVARLP